MFNSFWNVSPKTYSKAQRKAFQKKEICKGDPFPEIELPRHCDEQRDRQTLDFRGAIKILDDEDDLLVINENSGSRHLAIPLGTTQESNKASDIAFANVPFSSFDDFNPDDDRWTAFNSTPRSSSMIGADEEIDNLSTIRSEEFNLTFITEDTSDQEQGTSKVSNASDKENEVADRQRTSDGETEDVTPVETKNKFLSAKCRKGTPHPMVKLPPLMRQGRLFEPLKNKRNATTKDEATQKQIGRLASFPKYGDIPMKARNWKINLENDKKWEMKFKNNDENRSDDKKSKYPDKVDVQLPSSKAPVSEASGANPRNAVAFKALLKPKPKLKSSSALKVVPRVDDDPKNVDEFPVVEILETNLEKPDCCHNDDSSPDVENRSSIGNCKTDEVVPTCGRIAKSARIEDSARSHDDDFTPPRSKRTKVRRKKRNLGLRKKKSNKMEGRGRKLPQQNLVSKKELDFVKITDLLEVLKTNNEDDDDIQNRADYDNDGEGSRSKHKLEIPASCNSLPSAKKQLTSTILRCNDDRGFASETLKSSLRPPSMAPSSIRYETESSLLEKHPTTREVDSRELMELASPGNRSFRHEESRVADGENAFRVENVKIMEEGDAAAEIELPVSKNPEKINNDSIEECWLTRDIDYDWGPCYLEVYKYQTYDPNFNYPQDDLELA